MRIKLFIFSLLSNALIFSCDKGCLKCDLVTKACILCDGKNGFLNKNGSCDH